MDTLKTVIFSRLAQIGAKFLGVLLAGWGAWLAAKGHDPNLSPEQAQGIAEGVMQLVGAGLMVLTDLVIHAIRAKSTAPEIEQGPNLNGLLLIVLPGVLLLGGCGKPPPSIAEGRNLTRTAYLNVANNEAQIIEALITAYRSEANARIDAAVAAELKLGQAAAGATANTLQTMEFVARVYADRDAKRAEVEASCARVRVIVAQARKDLVIAAKLEGVLDEYEQAGIDVSKAGKAVGEILALLKDKIPAGAIVPLK